jgi:putative intracellular protease/amidase
MKILMVLTSHDQLGDTGLKTGFWLEEGAAPYFVFRDAGVQLTLASPKGGSLQSIQRAIGRKIRPPPKPVLRRMRRHRKRSLTPCGWRT